VAWPPEKTMKTALLQGGPLDGQTRIVSSAATTYVELVRDDDHHPVAWVQYRRDRVDGVWRILEPQRMGASRFRARCPAHGSPRSIAMGAVVPICGRPPSPSCSSGCGPRRFPPTQPAVMRCRAAEN